MALDFIARTDMGMSARHLGAAEPSTVAIGLHA